jgi:transposase
MTLPEDTTSLNWEALLALVAQLQHQVSQLQRQVARLTASNEALQTENAELKRGAKRQAAPFSKGTRVSQPKRPGRQPGSGTFSFRQVPKLEEITEPHSSALHCGYHRI